MNFFRDLFNYLFHKEHILTKKVYTLGAVIVTSSFISLCLLGAGGFATSLYGHFNEKDQVLVAEESEDLDMEDLTEQEEPTIASLDIVDENSICSYKEYYLARVEQNQNITMTLKKMPDTEVSLSTSGYAVASEEQRISYSAKELDIKANREPIELKESDYLVLLRIVEAEVGTEDLYCRTLIANVIINRMHNSYYPNTIEEVVFQNDGTTYQFSPILDGRYFDVEISELTRTAVSHAMAGYDNSHGALAFVNPTLTSEKTMNWFEENLIYVMEYGVIHFYRF